MFAVQVSDLPENGQHKRDDPVSLFKMIIQRTVQPLQIQLITQPVAELLIHDGIVNQIQIFIQIKTQLFDRIDAGADVLLSQLFFNNQYFYDYVTHCRMAGIEVPITPGIMPAINAKQIRRMVDLCGATLPDNTETILEKYGDNKDAMLDAGMAFATSQIIDLLAHGCDGVHLYIMNNPSVARKLCNSIVNII